MLLSAADPYKDGIPFVELWDMNNQKLIHKWEFKMRKFLSKTVLKLNKNSVNFTTVCASESVSSVSIILEILL